MTASAFASATTVGGTIDTATTGLDIAQLNAPDPDGMLPTQLNKPLAERRR